MTKVQELKAKLVKAQEKVAKCEGTIARHEKQLEKKLTAIAKHDTVDIDNLEGYVRLPDFSDSEIYSDIYDIKHKKEDIKGATRKLRDAQQIAENWEAKVNAELEKDKFLEGNAPQVIKDFLEEWKALAIDWSIKKYASYMEFRIKIKADELEAREHCIKTMPEYARYLDENGEVDDFHKRSGMLNMSPRKPIEDYLEEKHLDWKSIQERKEFFAGGTVLKMCEFSKEEERLAWLEKSMEAEKKAKMLDLINRIVHVVGVIEDASNLSISGGNLNGTIIGDKATATVNTIGAGGFNIQCFHYRTLIKKVS